MTSPHRDTLADRHGEGTGSGAAERAADLAAIVSRRRVLLAGGAVAGAGVLAACGGGSSSSTTPSSAAPATSGGASAPASTPAASGSAGGGAVLGPTSEVPVGGGTIFTAGDQKIVVTQPSAGVYEGFSAVCPHEGCNCNAVQDGVIVCPCHGSQFAITDGSVQRGPARQGLAPVSVAVAGGNVVRA